MLDNNLNNPKLFGQMNYIYGFNKLPNIKSETTLEAIKNGERTATTRYESQGNIDYWKNGKIGDIIRFTNKDGDYADVIIIKELHKLDTNIEALVWCNKEGWSVEYFEAKVKPKINEAYQLEFKLLDDDQIIIFEENESTNYQDRTVVNASADVTIAIGIDFTTAGEKLTKKAVKEQNKIYIPINANNLEIDDKRIDKIVSLLNDCNCQTLNIAGNGLYTFKLYNITQNIINDFVYKLLYNIINNHKLYNKDITIRSGGQSGADEAGAKAGLKLGLKTIVLSPKGWRFRNENNEDICDEKLFKQRFNNDSFKIKQLSENKKENFLLNLKDKMKSDIIGINIYSKSEDQLGKDLTAPAYAYNGKSKFDIFLDNDNFIKPDDYILPNRRTFNWAIQKYGINATAKDAWGYSAESWYQSNRDEKDFESNLNLMVYLLKIKFKTYPSLIEEIDSRGGEEFLKKCKHIVNGNSDWEGVGINSNYIKCLIEAYNKYKNK